MTREEMVKKGNKEAYNILAEDIKNYLNDYLEDSVFRYEYFDFTDDIFDLINKEKAEFDNLDIVHDIIDPALDKIEEKINEALKEEI